MALSLLEICREALSGVGSLNVPTFLFSNPDDDAAVLIAAAKQVGRELVREYNWQGLLSPATVTTSIGVSQYPLEADHQRFANQTIYNVTEAQPLTGPLPSAPWAYITRGIVANTLNYAFRVSGNNIELSPTPASVQTIGYDFFSKYYSTTPGGVAQENWLTDGDFSRLPDDVMVLGVRYRFLARRELPFAEDKADYLNAILQAQYDDTPKAVIDVSGVPRYSRDVNLPNANWG